MKNNLARDGGNKLKRQLETDDSGNILTNPVTGWTVVPVAGVAILLAVQYAKTPLELERGESQLIQLILQPAACLELAEALTTLARGLLNDLPLPGTTLH